MRFRRPAAVGSPTFLIDASAGTVEEGVLFVVSCASCSIDDMDEADLKDPLEIDGGRSGETGVLGSFVLLVGKILKGNAACREKFDAGAFTLD